MSEEIKRAFFSLSQTQRRNAIHYKKWALDDLSKGRTARAKRYFNISKQLWRQAFGNLNLAR